MSSCRRLRVGGWALAFAFAVAPAAAASPGALDPTFSGDGWTRTLEVRSASNNYLPDGADDVAIAPDGTIATAGELIDGGSSWYFGAFRFRADGALDPGFGEGGWVDQDIGAFEMPRAVAIQADGKIVVAGASDCALTTCFTLARYLPGGSPDPGFGAGGIAQTAFPQGAADAFDVAVAPGGKLVAVGFAFKGGDAQDSSLFAVARFLPDGRLDPSFSRDGHVTVDFGYADDLAEAVAVQPDGRIVVAGTGARNHLRTLDDFAIARLRDDGRLDRSFSGDGRRTVRFGKARWDRADALALGRGGRIVLAGSTTSQDYRRPPRIALVRLRRDGSLDRGFGAGGRRRTLPGPYGGYARAVLLHGGRIVAGGRAFADAGRDSSDWVLAGYTRAGALDPAFGAGGLAITDFGTGEDEVAALAAQGDRIVAAGSIYTSLGLARYSGR
jgi:uncharacterized delta-60 repeat protein